MMLACVLGLIVCNAVPGTILHLFFLHYKHMYVIHLLRFDTVLCLLLSLVKRKSELLVQDRRNYERPTLISNSRVLSPA